MSLRCKQARPVEAAVARSAASRKSDRFTVYDPVLWPNNRPTIRRLRHSERPGQCAWSSTSRGGGAILRG